MSGRKPARLRTAGDVLALDLRPIADVPTLALVGLGAVPDWVAAELNDPAWRALAELRRRVARFIFCGDRLPGAVIRAAADAVNRDMTIWWPRDSLPRACGSKRPDWNVTLSTPALWGVHAFRHALWALAACKPEGADRRRLCAAATAGGVLADLLGAEIGAPYDFGQPRPHAGKLEAAWRRFGAAIGQAPGLLVLPVLMAADDLAVAPAAVGDGCLAEAGGAGMNGERVVWQHDAGSGALRPLIALAHLCGRISAITSTDAELWGTEDAPQNWGVPWDILGPISGILSLSARLHDEWAQGETVLRWGMEGPEPECPVDATRFAEVVRQINTEAISVMRALVPWMASVEAAARTLDAATAAVAERRATVTKEEHALCVCVPEADGAAYA